ncbi:MAG: hypothetical protein ACPLZG_13285, partial [Thermoproteota archaeon]
YGVEAHPIQNLEIEPGKILVITYATKDASIPGESIIPLEPKELKVRNPIELGELSVDVEGRESIRISEALKKVFGYDNFKTLQEEVESNEVGLLLRFDDGSTAYCRTPKFSVHVPEGEKKIVSIEIYPVEKTKEDIINRIRKLVDKYKDIEEQRKNGKISEESAQHAKVDVVGNIGEEIAKIKLDEQKEEIAKYLNVPPERLFIEKLGKSGQVDFEIHQDSDKGTLLAIVEVKTTTVQGSLSEALMRAKNQLTERFSSEYKDIEHGFAIAIYIEDPEKLLQPGEKYDFLLDYYMNPYYKK